MSRLLVMCEAPADYHSVVTLLARLRQEEPPHVAEPTEGALRCTWRELKSVGPKVHGRFNGKGRTQEARKAIQHGRRLGVGAVVLSRDSDGDLAAWTAAYDEGRQIEAGGTAPLRVACAIAHPCREAWHLAGFVPEDDRERSALESETRRLGFDPTARGERLTASGGKASAKDILATLTAGDYPRAMACLATPALEHLRSRGGPSNLTRTLDVELPRVQ